MENNNKYEELEISVIEFEITDIITSSCLIDDGNDTPPGPPGGRQLHNLSYCFNTLHVRRRVFYSVGVKAFFRALIQQKRRHKV